MTACASWRAWPGECCGLRQRQMRRQRLGAGVVGILVPRDAFQQKDLSIEMHLDSGAFPICGCHRRARDAETAVLFNVSEDAEAEADTIDQMTFDAAQPLGRHADKDGASQSVNNAFVIAGGGK